MNQIKAGDVVQLKSGGPKMTVETVAAYNGVTKARCAWFDGSKKSVDLFPLESLTMA